MVQPSCHSVSAWHCMRWTVTAPHHIAGDSGWVAWTSSQGQSSWNGLAAMLEVTVSSLSKSTESGESPGNHDLVLIF